MKLNNKGFVASAVLYSLFVIFLFLIVGLLAMLQNRKMILDKLKGDIKQELNGMNEYTVYPNGTAIYYNPVTGEICSDYEEDNSLNENKTGCMKWYIFNDDKNKATVNMILDHNTTAGVAWNSSGNNEGGMNEVKTALENDTKSWNISARLITADEVAHIVGADSEDTLKWKSSKTWVNGSSSLENVSCFYLDGSGNSYSNEDGWKKQVANLTNKSKYYWLFDYTNNCESNGCNIGYLNTDGYWSSTALNGHGAAAWFIYFSGQLDFANIVWDGNGTLKIGVRPVITLNKKELIKPFEVTYDYTGDSQSFVRPVPGKYKIELWGAQGGGSNNLEIGKGAYTNGIVNLNSDDNLYVYVGQSGDTRNDEQSSGYITDTIFNGGSNSYYYSWIYKGWIYSGGGATDIRLVNGSWNNYNSLKSRIMVAGAAGGTMFWCQSIIDCGDVGNAGGLVGYGTNATGNDGTNPTGGTQISGGLNGLGTNWETIQNEKAAFGYPIFDNNAQGRGGAGYYAGGSGAHGNNTVSNGAGGSSFISGHNGCVAITNDSTEDNIIQRNDSKGNKCTDGTTDVTCSYHYSGLKFTDTVMIDGAGCKWTTEKTSDCSGMPTHDGKSTMTGNSGNGYAKITYLGE